MPNNRKNITWIVSDFVRIFLKYYKQSWWLSIRHVYSIYSCYCIKKQFVSPLLSFLIRFGTCFQILGPLSTKHSSVHYCHFYTSHCRLMWTDIFGALSVEFFFLFLSFQYTTYCSVYAWLILSNLLLEEWRQEAIWNQDL